MIRIGAEANFPTWKRETGSNILLKEFREDPKGKQLAGKTEPPVPTKQLLSGTSGRGHTPVTDSRPRHSLARDWGSV